MTGAKPRPPGGSLPLNSSGPVQDEQRTDLMPTVPDVDIRAVDPDDGTIKRRHTPSGRAREFHIEMLS